MNVMQSMVLVFHHALRQSIGDFARPSLVKHELRIKLIQEEADELVEAIKENDLTHAIKEACDLVYVTLGAMVEAGVDLEPFFALVHKSNMAKIGGPVSPEGKALKPPGWVPPDIAGLLANVVQGLDAEKSE